MIVIIKFKKTLKYCVKRILNKLRNRIKFMEMIQAFLVTTVLLFSGTDLHGPRCFYFLHSRFFFSRFHSSFYIHQLNLCSETFQAAVPGESFCVFGQGSVTLSLSLQSHSLPLHTIKS